MADFIDLFFPGDGEEVIVRFAEFVRKAKAAGTPREEVILEAARTHPRLLRARLLRRRGPDGAVRPTQRRPARARARLQAHVHAPRALPHRA